MFDCLQYSDIGGQLDGPSQDAPGFHEIVGLTQGPEVGEAVLPRRPKLEN